MMVNSITHFLLGGRKNMAAIGSMRKKLTGFSEEGDDDYGSAGMYFNPSMFPPHRPDKEVNSFGESCLFLVSTCSC